MPLKHVSSLLTFTLLSIACITPHAETPQNSTATAQNFENFNPQSTALTQEQARQAILNMAGEYEVRFTFAETYSNKPNYQLTKPKESDAYETVIVVENTPNKITLQHILQVSNLFIVKHWRQDWTFEPTEMWKFNPDYSWSTVKLTPEQSKGKWLQSVWQIDDSPRYAGLGEWKNNQGIIEWNSEVGTKPLPRRETTTRRDYDVIIGTNRHALTNGGWVHEQDNTKYSAFNQETLARERVVNFYQKIKNHNFAKSYSYWKDTENYWKGVRLAWEQAFKQNPTIALKFTTQSEDDKTAHFIPFDKQAKDMIGKNFDQNELNEKAKSTLNTVLIKGTVK